MKRLGTGTRASGTPGARPGECADAGSAPRPGRASSGSAHPGPVWPSYLHSSRKSVRIPHFSGPFVAFLGFFRPFWPGLAHLSLFQLEIRPHTRLSGPFRAVPGRSGHSWPVLGCSGPRIFGPARNPAAHRVFLGLFGPPASSAARFGPFPLRGSRKRAKKARGLNTNRCDFPVSCI